MADDRRREGPDWVDLLTRAAGALGMNPVRVRWKLEALRKRARGTQHRAGERVQHIRYEHKVCPSCGRLNDGEARKCVRCGEPIGARGWHVLQRVGLSLPAFVSVSSLLGTAMVVVYGRLLLGAEPGQGIMSFPAQTLLAYGGNWAPVTLGRGELWRLGTAVFLHAGLWHLGFNLIALSQIGPAIEEIFGRSRMLLFFMLTGLVASLGSALSSADLGAALQGRLAGLGGGVSIGASGALMGLVGMAAGWGQRDGTSVGRQLRNRMLKWTVYVVLFGYLIGADNVAHLVGLVAGGIVGLASPPAALARSRRVPVVVAQALVGGLLALGAFVLCLFPPPW